MQLDSLPCFLGNNLIQLASLVFTWEREILSENYLPQNMLSIGILKFALVLVSKSSVHSLWLVQN